jgi:stage II sporulation protein D
MSRLRLGVRAGLWQRPVSLLAMLALSLGSCAPPPPPASAPPPPTSPTVTQTPTPPPAPPAPFVLDAEPAIDVAVAWDLDSLTIDATRLSVGWWAGAAAGTPAGVGETITVRMTSKGAAYEWESGGEVQSVALGVDTLWVGDPRPEEKRPAMSWNGKTWRGRAKVFANPRGRLTLAFRLPLETYLLGVVPGEIGALAPELVEAGRAQAVAARSYTLFYRGRRGAEGFDLYGTVEDQMYGSVESEKPLATECVTSTHGEIAIADGRPIRANYCSTCGGITADVWEAWPASGLSYLKSHRDDGKTGPYCAGSPQYRWKEEWTAPAFVRTIERYAPAESVAIPRGGLGDLIDVRVAARSRSGRVWRLVVTATRGEVTIPAYSLRRVVRRPGESGAILRSNLFKIDVRRDPRTRRALAVLVNGAGSGHGVGLCQTGSLGMARAGAKGEEILEHYYSGIRLKRFY